MKCVDCGEPSDRMRCKACAKADRAATLEAFAKQLLSDAESPCPGCEHYQRCATQDLACCAFHAYVSGNQDGDAKRRARLVRWHRTPSSEWYARVFEPFDRDGVSFQGSLPHCPRCRRESDEQSRTSRAA